MTAEAEIDPITRFKHAAIAKGITYEANDTAVRVVLERQVVIAVGLDDHGKYVTLFALAGDTGLRVLPAESAFVLLSEFTNTDAHGDPGDDQAP